MQHNDVDDDDDDDVDNNDDGESNKILYTQTLNQLLLIIISAHISRQAVK